MEHSMKPNIFPMKLWHLVNNGEISAIIWNSHGDGIIVKQNLIGSQVLSLKSFKATAFTSFVRQLHMYGFRKSQICTRDRPNIHEYFHPNFKRSQPELLPLVKRHSGKYKCKVNLSTDARPQPWMEKKNVLQLPAKSYHGKVDRNPKAMHHQYFNPAHTNMLQPNGFFFSGLLCSEQKPVDLHFFNSFTYCKIGNFPGPQQVEPLSLTVKEKPSPFTRVSKMETRKIESISSATSSGSSTQSNNMQNRPVSAALTDIDNSTKEAAEILLLLSRKGSTESQ